MPTLYILCGLPFSGKSLLSKEIEKTTSIRRVSFDDMFDELQKINKNITYELGLNEIESKLTEELRAGNSVVYDSVNLSSKHRVKLKELAEQAGAQAKIIYLNTSAKEILKRREQSLSDNSHHTLDEEFVRGAINRLEPPTDAIILSTDKEKSDFLKTLK